MVRGVWFFRDPYVPGPTSFSGKIQPPAGGLGIAALISLAGAEDHMVLSLPPLLAAACQQLAELEAAGLWLQGAFDFKYWGGGGKPCVLRPHLAPTG